MTTFLAASAAALLFAAAPIDARLVGTWTTESQVLTVLDRDGTGRSEDGPLRWSAAGGVLTLTDSSGRSDSAAYRVEGDRLSLTMGGSTVQLRRLAPAPAAPKSGGPTPAVGPVGAGPATTGRTPARALRFNGRALGAGELATLERLERSIGRVPDGDYWYDTRTGASGRWGGPGLAFLPSGLQLGGELPAGASGGGQGTLTGVFVNGRELHPVDVAGLQELVGQVLPGRWWVDGAANYGLEGGPPAGNLMAIARARQRAGQGGGRAWSKHYEGTTPRGNMNLASDGNTTCVSVSGYSHCTGE
jgi:hypothetical protein